jgi:RNA polymerase sigma factor (sigma-70 family)
MGQMEFARTTDESLLRMTPSDVDAFGEFYRRHERAVLVYFMRRTSAPDVAADLSAETFAAALQAAGQFRGDGSALGWLFTIARNILTASYRRARVQNEIRERLGIAELTITDEIADALERLQRQAEGSEAMELFQDLPEHERAGRGPPHHLAGGEVVLDG